MTDPLSDSSLAEEKVYIAYDHKTSPPQEIDISRAVYEQYEEVRREGFCNMFDQLCVQSAAFSMDFFELVSFIDDPTVSSSNYLYLLKNYSDIRAFYKDADPVLPTMGEVV